MLQAKLTVGQPGDIYQQEADRIAEEVMRMPDAGTSEKTAVSTQAQFPHIQRTCPECEEKLHRQVRGIQIRRVCSECEGELHLQRMDEGEEELLLP